MAFVSLFIKARRIAKRQKRLKVEKEHAFKLYTGEKAKYTLSDKYHRFFVNVKTAIRRFFGRIFSLPKKSWLHKTCFKLRHTGTLENFLLKSVIGFFSGFVLIYIFFMFFVVILNFSLGVATFMCSFFGCILTVGLAFSETIRQIVLLILPQFFSKRGREALIAYAFIIALSGPVRNTLNNLGILSESLACGQEQLKQAVRQIIDLIKKPFIAIKEAIKKIINVVKSIVKKIKEIFLTIKRIVMCIVNVIKTAFKFLGKIFNICSKKVGTPFERCVRVFDNGVSDCYAKLGPLFNWLCSIAYVTKLICYILKPLDFICMLLDFINNSVIGVIIRKIKKFIRHVRTTFYVRIRFSHSFKFETTSSKSMKEVTQGIVNEIKDRTATLRDIFSFLGTATSFFFLFIILKAIIYRYKYLTNERYDNKYITRDFRVIDFRRAQMEKETILPLNNRERNKYITFSSCRLIKTEKKSLKKALSVLIVTTFKLGAHMFTDYSLWWILDKIRFYGKFTRSYQVPQTVGINVQGNGFVAGLFKTIVKAFNPLGVTMNVDTVPCLPDPIPPNYDKYIQIGVLLGLSWILAISEPYGLRLRAYVMNYYYPTRARERSIWLYNHILRNRTSFLKFARRALKRKFFGSKDPKQTKITCKEFIRSRINVGWLLWILKPCIGRDAQEACVLCATVFRYGEDKPPIRCATPGCPGIYCEQCFADLQNICSICLDPIQYGDLSDLDEEMDSSEDDTTNKYKRKIEKKKQKKKSDEECQICVEYKCAEDEDGDNDEDELIPNRMEGGQDISTPCSSSLSDTDTSTEYSYSYQYEKNFYDEDVTLRTPFVDIEEQYLPDYAAMNTFQNYLFNFLDDDNENDCDFEDKYELSDDEEYNSEQNTLFQSKYSKKIEDRLDYSSSNEDTVILSKKFKTKTSLADRTIRKVNNWLSTRTMFSSKVPESEENIPLLEMNQQNENLNSSGYPKQTLCEFYAKQEVKTKDRIENNIESDSNMTSRLLYLYPNIRYEEVNENNSINCDSFININPLCRRSTNILRKRKKYTSNKSSITSEDRSNKYKEKVRQYYKNLPS